MTSTQLSAIPTRLQVRFHELCSVLGGVCPGDQLLNVEGTSLLGVSVQQAHEELSKAMNRNSVSLCLMYFA